MKNKINKIIICNNKMLYKFLLTIFIVLVSLITFNYYTTYSPKIKSADELFIKNSLLGKWGYSSKGEHIFELHKNNIVIFNDPSPKSSHTRMEHEELYSTYRYSDGLLVVYVPFLVNYTKTLNEKVERKKYSLSILVYTLQSDGSSFKLYQQHYITDGEKDSRKNDFDANGSHVIIRLN